MNDKIIIRGARENNLRNVTLAIPRNKLVVMTGLSGSGKSSLALRGGKITGNIAHKAGAGVYVAGVDSQLAVSGDVQIQGNTLANGAANNLQLRDGKLISVGQLGGSSGLGWLVCG